MIVGELVRILLSDSGVAAITGGRVYPLHMPDAPNYPCICISKVGGSGQRDFCGEVGKERARVQVDVFGLQYQSTVDLAKAVRAVILARPPPGEPCMIDSASCINDMDSPAGEPLMATERAGPRVRHRLLDFVVWCKPY